MKRTRLDVYDVDPYVHIYCASGDYLYAKNPDYSSFVYRRLKEDSEWTQMGDTASVDSSYIIRRIHSTLQGGTILVEVYKAVVGGEFDLLRSTDGGKTFAKVFDFGDGNGVDSGTTESVRTFGKICVAERNLPSGVGQGRLYIGEYNINDSRTAGGVNDRVRIMQSDDHGATWETVTNFNTDGHQTRHVHTIRQDPYTGHIYLMFGDSDSEAAIVRWDGVATWPDNSSWETLAAAPGFAVCRGAQKNRVADCLFTKDYVFSYSDTPKSDTDNAGIWRWDKDLSRPLRVMVTPDDFDDKLIGWWGCKLGDTLFFTASLGSPWTVNPGIPVFASEDGGYSWYTAGINRIYTNLPTTTGVNPQEIWTDSDKAYLYIGYDALHQGTRVLYVNGTAPSDYFPETLWPVLFVGDYGAGTPSDSNTGYSRSASKASIKGAVEGNFITGGTRILVAPATYTSLQASPDWNNTALTFYNSEYPCIIEGRGQLNTDTVWKNIVGGNSNLLFLSPSNTFSLPVILRNMHIYNDEKRTITFAADGMSVHCYDCVIGKAGGGPAIEQFVVFGASNCEFITERCVLVNEKTNGNWSQVGSGLTGIKQKHSNFVMLLNNGGQGGMFIRGTGGHFKLYNGLVIGGKSGSAVVQVYSGVNIQPDIKNVIFDLVSGAVPITDGAGVTESGVDYNCYHGGAVNINVTDGGHSITADPLLDAEYKPTPQSPCIGAGIDVGLTTDADGNAVPGAVGYDIGPYSYMPGWMLFDESMPALTLAPTAPGDLKQVQAWSKVATAKEIEQNNA